MGRGRGQGNGWDEGDTEGESDGAFGGPGRGEGGSAPEKAGDTETQKTKVNSMLGKGKYAGAYSMKGEPPQGEALTEYSEVQRAASTEAMDALSKQKVPATHRDFVRDYFDAIRIDKK